MNETVTVIHTDGTRHENVRALVQKNKIFIADATLPLSVGDLIERNLPSGQLDIFRSTNVHLWTGMGSFSSYFEINYEREGAGRHHPRPATVNVNVTDSPQTHINLNSTDQSTSTIDAQGGDIFAQMRELIEERLSHSDDFDLLIERVEDMESNQGSSNFLESYKGFIAVAANHMAILGPVLPSLTAML